MQPPRFATVLHQVFIQGPAMNQRWNDASRPTGAHKKCPPFLLP